VAAHLPLPDEDAAGVDELLRRLDGDTATGLSYREEDREPLARILDDLQDSGDAKHLDGSDGWRMTKAGLGKLTGPALTDVSEVDGELQRVEPAPLEGPKLEEAEAQQDRIAEEDAAGDEKAATARVKAAQAELDAAEAALKEATDGE
jgi:hypothetical protein